MRKFIATVALVGALMAPTSALAAGAAIGGDYGTRTCYVTLDYFWVDVTIDSRYPFVHESHGGTVGGEVHCPISQSHG